MSWRGLRLTEARQRSIAARSPGPVCISPGQVCGQEYWVPRWTANTRSMLWFSRPNACTAQSTSPMAEPPHPARMNSGAAGWVVAVAGRSATSSGIFGPWGCAQSWGTHTVRHCPGCPWGAQLSQVVPNSAGGAGGLRAGDDLPPQPAAVSTATAASAAHHRSQRREGRSPDAGAVRMPAMLTSSCRNTGLAS